MRSSVSLVLNDYSGFIGLNTNTQDFQLYVMQPEEIVALFSDSTTYDAIYAYPQVVAGGFREPPVFSGKISGDQSLTLQAEIVTNEFPKTCLTWFASKLLPASYIAKDRIEFAADKEHGFGRGTCRVTTLECIRHDGSDASFARKLIAVENRPALFLKIRDRSGAFYPDIAIFFPDKVSGMTHQPVKNGEAFVLAKEGTWITQELLRDIIDSFNYLVNTSLYSEGNNLYSTNYKTPIESGISRLIVERNRLD